MPIKVMLHKSDSHVHGHVYYYFDSSAKKADSYVACDPRDKLQIVGLNIHRREVSLMMKVIFSFNCGMLDKYIPCLVFGSELMIPPPLNSDSKDTFISKLLFIR